MPLKKSIIYYDKLNCAYEGLSDEPDARTRTEHTTKSGIAFVHNRSPIITTGCSNTQIRRTLRHGLGFAT